MLYRACLREDSGYNLRRAGACRHLPAIYLYALTLFFPLALFRLSVYRITRGAALYMARCVLSFLL